MGSRSTWSSTPPTCISPWAPTSTAKAMEAALELEKTVNQSLLDLHKCADSKGDAHLCDFLEAEYLGVQVEGIKNIGDWIVKIKRAGDGLGLHLMDNEIGS